MALVKKEKVRAIEESLIAAATTGKLPGRVSSNYTIPVWISHELIEYLLNIVNIAVFRSLRSS